MPFDAFMSGLISAISLPIGALIGIIFRPGRRVVAAVMAFGSGALLAAISFELLDPALETAGIGALAIGFVAGSVLYVALNAAIQNLGGFLRKRGTLSVFAKKQAAEQVQEIIEKLSRVPLMRSLPPEEMRALVPYVRPVTAQPREVVVKADQEDFSLYMVVSGQLDVLEKGASETDPPLRMLKDGDAFGDVALLMGEPR